MNRRARISILNTLTVALAAGLAAEDANPVLAKKEPTNAAAASAPKHHVFSPEVAGQLSALTPKFNPQAPKPQPKKEEEEIDLRDIDKPRNGIVRLPKYVVREAKPAVLNERAVHTEKGITEIAMRRYISETDRVLNRFSLPLFAPFSTAPGSTTEQRAMAMYAEDERLDNMRDVRANAVDAAKSDPAAGEYIRREAQKTFIRPADFGWNGGK